MMIKVKKKRRGCFSNPTIADLDIKNGLSSLFKMLPKAQSFEHSDGGMCHGVGATVKIIKVLKMRRLCINNTGSKPMSFGANGHQCT